LLDLLMTMLFCALSPAYSQEPPSLTLRTTSHMVVFDLLVKDRAGRPVTGVNAGDVTLTEDGKPQVIDSFTSVVRNNQRATQPASLPEHVYTNRPEYEMPNGPVTIILIDILNTSAQDQAYARGRLLKYVTTELKPGEPVAVYTLARSLTLLQDFTTDPEVLRIAIEAVNPKINVELQMADVEKRLPHIHESGGTNPATRARIMSLMNSLREFYAEQAESELEARISRTLAAFRMIGRAVAGHPGPKNLVWVSGAFPLTITKTAVQYRADLSDPNRVQVTSQTNSSYSAEELFRQTVSLLGEAQVSVYPVDARGLVGSLTSDASDNQTDETGQFLTGADYGAAISRSNSMLLEDQHTMDVLAEQTGGSVFKNRNEIDDAVRDIVADSGSYYEIGYYPQNHNWNGSFRKIEIRLRQPETVASYRRGYYAIDPLRAPKNKNLSEADLRGYVGADAPAATMIVFDARVVPPAPASSALVPVEFLVDMHCLAPEENQAGVRKYQLDFHVAAFGKEGKLMGQQNMELVAPVKPERYASLQRTGLPFHTDLSLPPGEYRLRLVVRDEHTGFLGSMDLPLVLKGPNR
jgi:VWFA-related protein